MVDMSPNVKANLNHGKFRFSLTVAKLARYKSPHGNSLDSKALGLAHFEFSAFG